MIRPIVVVGNPVLRQKARRVSQVDRPLQKLIDDMIETMQKAPGVGLAAPQVGVPLRLAVIEVDDKITVVSILRSSSARARWSSTKAACQCPGSGVG